VEDERRGLGQSDFGTLLRQYRIAAGLSQEALAERARMSTNGIGALERGYRRTPQRETLGLLVRALELDDERRQEFEAAAQGQGRAGAGISTLPLALTSFVGRDAELDEIARLVRDHRLVTLIGVGGIGKTQTALHLATRLSREGGGSAAFVALETVGDHSLVVAAIATALGVPEVPRRPLLDTLLAYLKGKSLLLLLDNCEHLIPGAACVAEELLSGCSQLRVLATSREPLKAAGECAYRLPSLSPEYSIALFVDRARSVNHRFSLTGGDRSTLEHLCRRLDGIPLAIELAAARMNALSLKTLTSRLDDSFRLLTGGARTALPRHQTMRAMVDWSYNLLSEREQRVFERLSVFSGGCTLDAAALVCADGGAESNDTFDILSSLVDKSLVTPDCEGRETRYRLLETFRQYARERLEERGDAHGAAHRHAHASLGIAERFNRYYECESDDVWRALAREELGNWRAALQWALAENGDVLVGQRLAAELRVIWQYFGHPEGQRWVQLALDLADGATPVSVVAELEYAMAVITWQLREHEAHLESSRSALAHYREACDALGIARAQGLIGHALVGLGRDDEGVPMLEDALAQARTLGSSRLIAYTVRCLGYVSGTKRGDIVTARERITEALTIYERLGARVNAAFTLNDLGECEFCAGNAEAALRHAADAVERLREFADLPLVATALDSMTAYLVALGRYDEGELCARELLDLARDHRLDVLTAYALQHLAAIAALRSGDTRTSATRVLGFVDARLKAMGAARLHNHEQFEYDRVLATLIDAMDANEVERLMTAGAAMSEELAIDEALSLSRASA
jgi:predicted ATPase/DNA-binding XRE family transcriptional regulator